MEQKKLLASLAIMLLPHACHPSNDEPAKVDLDRDKSIFDIERSRLMSESALVNGGII